MINPVIISELKLIERAVLVGAQHLLQAIQSKTKLQITYKADRSIVMNLDLECQEKILAILGQTLPVIAEEDSASHEKISTLQDYFLVDPLDGTSACKRFFTEQGGQVGFGPLIGLVKSGRLVAAAFYHVPQKKIYTSVFGKGCYSYSLPNAEPENLPELQNRQQLKITNFPVLSESAVVFYTGVQGEFKYVEFLRRNNIVENCYRFGGFANDCVRLACGSEQIEIQFSLFPWDYSAVLFPLEAGYELVVDPLQARKSFLDWKIQKLNPVLIAPPGQIKDLLFHFDQVK